MSALDLKVVLLGPGADDHKAIYVSIGYRYEKFEEEVLKRFSLKFRPKESKFYWIDRYKDKIFFSDEIDYRMYLDHKRISWIYLDIIDKSLASVKTTTSAKKSEAPSGAAASNGAEKYDEILRNFASLTDLFKSIDPNLRTNAAKKQISISEEIPITDSPRFVATNIPEHFRDDILRILIHLKNASFGVWFAKLLESVNGDISKAIDVVMQLKHT